MIDNLKNAINHAREVAKNWESQLVNCVSEEGRKMCKERAENSEQIAAWLEELAERREADRWIPVSERLPEDYTKVLITNEYGIVTCVIWNTWYQNEYKDAKKEYKAIAWKPVPKRYESEADDD